MSFIFFSTNYDLFIPYTMTLGQGDNQGFAMKAEIQDYSKALEVLEKDYPTRDGLDVDTLLDSDKHGALTYNDFLILPGHIGTF